MKTDKNKSRTRHGTKTHSGLEKLWTIQLREILTSERLSLQILPKTVHNVASPNLTVVVKGYIEITRQQINRLEQIFKIKDIPARGKKSVAAKSLSNETRQILENTIYGPVRDAGVIATVQKIIHYQISAYNTLSSWGFTLNEARIAEMLALAATEEKEADRLLSESAYSTINYDAAIDENKKITDAHYNPNL